MRLFFKLIVKGIKCFSEYQLHKTKLLDSEILEENGTLVLQILCFSIGSSGSLCDFGWGFVRWQGCMLICFTGYKWLCMGYLPRGTIVINKIVKLSTILTDLLFYFLSLQIKVIPLQ